MLNSYHSNFDPVSSYPNGFAFILGFLAPLWVVGGFDSSVHISEEARNANVAIPRAVVLSTAVTCVLGWGMYFPIYNQLNYTCVLFF